MDNTDEYSDSNNPQQSYYEEENIEDYGESMDIEEEEEPNLTFICDSCGYENDIYSDTCLACEKSLYDI